MPDNGGASKAGVSSWRCGDNGCASSGWVEVRPGRSTAPSVIRDGQRGGGEQQPTWWRTSRAALLVSRWVSSKPPPLSGWADGDCAALRAAVAGQQDRGWWRSGWRSSCLPQWPHSCPWKQSYSFPPPWCSSPALVSLQKPGAAVGRRPAPGRQWRRRTR